jgi:hypothetical protein
MNIHVQFGFNSPTASDGLFLSITLVLPVKMEYVYKRLPLIYLKHLLLKAAAKLGKLEQSLHITQDGYALYELGENSITLSPNDMESIFKIIYKSSILVES